MTGLKKNLRLCNLRIFLIMVVFLACEPGVAWSERNKAGTINLAPYARVLVDPTAALTLSEVSDLADQFTPLASEQIYFKLTEAAYWVRFSLPFDPSELSNGWVLEVGRYFSYFFSEVDLFTPRPEGGYSHAQAGSDRTVPKDRIRMPKIYLTIPEEFKPGAYAFLRLKCRVDIQEPLSLVPRDQLLGRDMADMALPVFAFGILLAMIGYNFLLLLGLRMRVYLYYTLNVCCTFVWQFFAVGYVFVFFDLPAGVYLPVGYFFARLSGAFALMVIRTFLNTRQMTPVLDRIFLTFIGGWILSLILVFPGQWELAEILAYFLGLASIPLVIWTTVVRIRQGFGAARFLLLAWGALGAGLLVYSLQNMELIPTTVWTIHSFLFGATLESVFLSLALAELINKLKREKNELEEREQRYRNLSRLDSLTGLF